MLPITMYSTPWCPYCVQARRLLDQRGVEYRDISVDGEPQLRKQMMERSGRHTVPQIWIGDDHIGGYTDLRALDMDGRLDRMLGQTGAS